MAERQPPASQSEKKEKSYAEFETAANELLERSRQLLEAAASYSSKLKAEGDAIGSQATALGKDIKALQTEVSKAADRDEISIDEAEKLEDEIKRARSAVYDGDVTALMPHKANDLPAPFASGERALNTPLTALQGKGNKSVVGGTSRKIF